MENKKVKCTLHFKRKIIQYYELLGYHLDDEKNLSFSRVALYFSRQEEPSEKVSDIELKYSLAPSLSLFPVVFMSIGVIVLATLFLIFTFTDPENKMQYFVYYMIPGLSLLLLTAVYSFIRYSFDSKNIEILTDLNKLRIELGIPKDEQEKN